MERALAVRTIFGVLAIGLLVISLATVSSKGHNQATAQDNFPKVRLWEYKSLRVDGNARSDEQLNILGAEGWELVSTAYVPGRNEVVFYFKRARS